MAVLVAAIAAVSGVVYTELPAGPIEVDDLEELYEIRGRALECREATQVETDRDGDLLVRSCHWNNVTFPGHRDLQVILEFKRHETGPWELSGESII